MLTEGVLAEDFGAYASGAYHQKPTSISMPAKAMDSQDIQILLAAAKSAMSAKDIRSAIQFFDIGVGSDNSLDITMLPATGRNEDESQMNIAHAIGGVCGVYVCAINNYEEIGDLHVTFGNKYSTIGTAYALRPWAESVDKNDQYDLETLVRKVFGTITVNTGAEFRPG
jgi:hypothetical protein